MRKRRKDFILQNFLTHFLSEKQHNFAVSKDWSTCINFIAAKRTFGAMNEEQSWTPPTASTSKRAKLFSVSPKQRLSVKEIKEEPIEFIAVVPSLAKGK